MLFRSPIRGMDDSQDVQPSALSWEIIETIIVHSSSDSSILCNLALTCRALRPRSILVLLTHVRITCRDKLLYLCDVLQANPEHQPSVRSLAIPLKELSPFPLLSMLPNLHLLLVLFSMPFPAYSVNYLVYEWTSL